MPLPSTSSSEDHALDVTQLQKELLPAVVQAAQQVTKLCGAMDSDLSYYQAIYPDVLNAALPSLSQRLIDSSQAIVSAASYSGRALMECEDAYIDLMQDVMEDMLEACDHQLDLAFGRIKAPCIEAKVSANTARRSQPRLFQTAPAHLTVIKPTDISIHEPTENPYVEITKNLDYSSYLVPRTGEVDKWRALEETPLIWVDTEDGLDAVISDLSQQQAIAVDLEHHSMHSYHGVTCLMQISTAATDYLIDTIRLRSSIPKLEPIFSNPSILKLMHGAESDTAWLQRDFNIFIVGLFDTFFAAKALKLERFSFAHIAKHYVGLDIDKTHQLSDWRVRPLPEDMQLYARQDTHYLFYIYECMKKELRERSPESLREVFQRSASQCLKLFRLEKMGPNDWKAVTQGTTLLPFNKAELGRVKAIYEWRDQVARKEDVSVHALLPNQMIVRLAQARPGTDYLALLKASRYDMALVMKNMETLKQTIESATFEKIEKKEQIPVEPFRQPEHIVFKDSDDEEPQQDKETKRVLVATELCKPSKRTKRAGSSMAAAFSAPRVTACSLDLAPVVSQLDIVKVETAAQMLQAAANPTEDAQVHEAENVIEDPIPHVNQAVVLKTGEVMDEEELLAKAVEKHEFSFSTKQQRKAAQEPVVPFDFSQASDTLADEPADVDGDVKLKSYEFKPVFDTVTFTRSADAAPRLPTQPRSGNRQKTFYD